MAKFGANLELIPIYLESPSKDELIRLMFLNNQINAAKFNYMSPLKDGKNWIVWFFADIKDWNDPNDLDEDDIAMLRSFGE